MSIEEEALKWLKQTGDIVERECADTVCSLIPNYAVLWAKFIGNDQGKAEPYFLYGIDSLDEEQERILSAGYEKFCAAHYTLFNHIYSASRKICISQETETKPRNGLTHAIYFEALEEFFFHFGVALTQLERMWAIILEKDSDKHSLRSDIKSELIRIFGEGSPELTKYQNVIQVLEATRHHVEHHSRSAIYYDKELKNILSKYHA